MIIFRKVKDKTNQFDNTDVTIESDSVTLTDLLDDFKSFLLACGYVIRPEEDIVILNDEEINEE